MDRCAFKRTTTEPVESALESVKNNVLDDNRARVGIGMGGQAILCCEGDKGWIQSQASWCVVSSFSIDLN
jgi:hypothetical protein